MALPAGAVLSGELSLAGEVRPVRRMVGRARAAKAMGLARVIGPAEGSAAERKEWEQVASIGAMVRALFGTAPASSPAAEA
jgi:DNA repair protein RadA/Sms